MATLKLADFKNGTFAQLRLNEGTIDQKTDKSPDFTSLPVVIPKNTNKRVYTKMVDSFPQLFTANIDDTNEKQLTKGVDVTSNFYVTSDGGHIVFYGAMGTDAGVFILSIDGGTPVKVANSHIVPRGAGALR